MFYDGPTQKDYVNIHALNREFLRLTKLYPQRFGLDTLQAGRLAALGRQQSERLASTPFLLFAIQENDEIAWRALCRARPNNDLFESNRANDTDINDLIATTAGFLWQLAQQNPYSVRLICGASPAWCEIITAMTYFELITLTRQRDDLLSLRQTPNSDIWSKLLVDGVRAEPHVRSAAHIAALQTMLSGYPAANAATWPVAACKTTYPGLHVADEPGKA